jgi:hypothetical protein
LVGGPIRRTYSRIRALAANRVIYDEDNYRADYGHHDARLIYAGNTGETERGEDCTPDDGPYDAEQDVAFSVPSGMERLSASTSSATVEKIGPSSEVSAASQSCSRRLTVFSGIGVVPHVVDVRAVSLEPSPHVGLIVRAVEVAGPGCRCIWRPRWRERGSRGRCTVPSIPHVSN